MPSRRLDWLLALAYRRHVSFSRALLVFRERVRSKTNACFDILFLIGGLLGMSYYSYIITNSKADTTLIQEANPLIDRNGAHRSTNSLLLAATDSATGSVETTVELSSLTKRVRQATQQQKYATDATVEPNESKNNTPGNDDDQIMMLSDNNVHEKAESTTNTALDGVDYVKILGQKIPKRQWGMLLAGLFGLWMGSSMVPMKLAPREAQGSRFLISFSIGASMVNLVLWLLRYLYGVYHFGSFKEAFAALPSFHLRVMWKPGCLSGFLWSIGNFFNLISVYYLGQGVGYPLVQSSMVISGLWGIFYFKEVQGCDRISKWIMSSFLALVGIVMLGREHVRVGND